MACKTPCEYQAWGERHVSRYWEWSAGVFNAPIRALPYIEIGIQKLISLSLLRSLSPKDPLSICNTLEEFGQVVVEGFRPFSNSW